MPFIRRLTSLCLAASCMVAMHLAESGTARAQDAAFHAGVCAAEAARAEGERGLPPHILQAIALVETGRWDERKGASFAWPWTVTAEGQGRYMSSKRAAIDEVRRLRAKGVRNIDVGCMQINLLHHPDAFESLEKAFDPRANVAYAADFLTSLFQREQSWVLAAGRYHSGTPTLNRAYRARFIDAWEMARGRPAPSHDALYDTLPSLFSKGDPAPKGLTEAEKDRLEAQRMAEDWRAERLAAWRARHGGQGAGAEGS